MPVNGNGERDENIERLLDEFRALVNDVDPVPPEVTSFARAAIGFRRIETELAELEYDSLLDPAAMAFARSVERARSMTFEASDLEIAVELRDETPGVLLLGQLDPRSRASIEVQRDDESIVASADADALGRFRVELPEGARIRLRVLREFQPPVETSWIRT